jgi:sulfide:quinone oxidoreductase
MPQLFGPSHPGVPGGAIGGFIPVDEHCAVRGLEHVFAAGDATDFPVKHGSIAAQQADAAAQAIAALAGAPVTPTRFDPVIEAVLIGGAAPLYLRARVTGGRGVTLHAGEEPGAGTVTKISARHLAPYLESRDALART